MKASSVSPWRPFSGVVSIILLLALTVTPPTVIMAQQPAASNDDAAKKSADADLPPLPLSPIEKAEKDGTSLRLSLRDITKMALENNLDIAIQDTNEELSQQKILQAYGAYDPTLTVSAQRNFTKSANTNTSTASAAGNFNQSDTYNWSAGFSQPLKTGATVKVDWSTRRSSNNQAFSLFNPQWNSPLTANITQPLWRNFRIDSNRSQIKLVNLDLKSSDSQFKQKVTETISSIQSRYWDLVSAIRDYDIKRGSVRLAQISLRDNKKKVEVGTLAPIGVTEAEATMAQREVDLITSEERILNVENALRSVISNNRSAEIWSKVIVPVDTPEFKEYKIDLNNAINTALANRPELEQADISLKKTDINNQLIANNRKWQVDLQASLGGTGVAGPQGFRFGMPQTPPEMVGGMGTSYKNIFTSGSLNWTFGFQIQIPLRNRSLDAQLAQQQITKRQQLMQRKNTEQTILVDVRNAVQSIETNRKQVETARKGRQLAEEQLSGEEKRFQAGLSQNYLVLQRQNELATAQYTELTTLINYKKSVITLQKAMYTLLESNDFEVAKSSSSSEPAFK